MSGPRVAVVGGNGKTGVAVCEALRERGAEPVPLGRAEWDDLAGSMAGCGATYLIAPNFHPDEPGYVAHALEAARAAGVPRVVYHSVASPYVPGMPHHVGKAVAEDLVRRSGLRWTILQPGVYVENFDLGRTVRLPYRADAEFGFLRLADLGVAAAEVLLDDEHVGATYELASLQGTVADLAREAGVDVIEESAPADLPDGLASMFAYYDVHGLPAGVLTMRALLAERRAA